MFIGALLAKKRIDIKAPVAMLGLFLSVIALIGEAFIIHRFGLAKDHNMYISLLPAVFFLLYIALHLQIKSYSFYKTLRITGIIIFFSHLFVHSILKGCFLLASIVWGRSINNSLAGYFLTIVFAALLGFAIEKLSKNPRFSYLKWLYS